MTAQPNSADAEDAAALRPRLFGIAYRLLGTVSDADDAVQEAYVRWQRVDRAEVAAPEAFLVKTVTRTALDRWRSLHRTREEYVGPWLPEPLVGADAETPSARLERLEAVSLALLVVLETLGPVERAVFLLREVFQYDYAQVAEFVGESEANCRQLLHRAKARLAEGGARQPSSREEQTRLTQAFLVAVGSGQMAPLTDLLAEDVVAWSDGGGRVPAALAPIRGRDAVGRYVLGTSRKGFSAAAEVRLCDVNGQVGIVVTETGRVTNVIVPEISHGRIQALRTIRNPEKLRMVTGPPDAEARL